MATWEHQLLSRIIRTGDIQAVTRWGITPEDFVTNEGNELYRAVLGYSTMPSTAGAVPGVHAIQHKYPTFPLMDDCAMTTEALCHEVRSQRAKLLVQEIGLRAGELSQRAIPAAVDELEQRIAHVRRLVSAKQTDVYATEAMERIMQRYTHKELGEDTSICPWPWAPLQQETFGIQPDDYVVFYGRPKSMKTWVVAYLIAQCYYAGKRLLLYTKEMTADNILQRVFCIMASVDYSRFRGGALSCEEKLRMDAVRRLIIAQEQTQPLVCLSGKDAGEGGDTVLWLKSKIQEHQPHICFVDGMYLMSDSNGPRNQKDHARVQNISRGLRSTVLALGVPIVATIQANRDADKNQDANLSEIAFSDAIGQDATLAVRVINEKNVPTLALVIGGSREFSLEGFRIQGIPAYNFGYAGPLDSSSADNAIATDTRRDDAARIEARKNNRKPPTRKQEEQPTGTEQNLEIMQAVDWGKGAYPTAPGFPPQYTQPAPGYTPGPIYTQQYPQQYPQQQYPQQQYPQQYAQPAPPLVQQQTPEAQYTAQYAAQYPAQVSAQQPPPLAQGF